MKFFPRTLLFCLICVFSVPVLAAAPVTGSPAGGAAMPSLAPMVARVSPAVVNISTFAKVRSQSPLLNDPFFRRFFNVPQQQLRRRSDKPRAIAAGSGVIVNADKGYILTNAHVIKGADIIKVTLKNGHTYKAKLIGQDKQVDLAVLQVKAKHLTQISISAPDQLRVGDYVVAIGNPFALGQTVTSGIVSALGRTGLGIEGYENFIQTDASINPGNSGGALVNLKGELVGIPTAIIAPSGGNVGIGFAIPTSMAVNVMHQLIKYGEVKRGMLGVTIQTLTPVLANAFDVDKDTKGVVITQVLKDSAAQQAGLQAGDVITALNGKPVASAARLRDKIGLTPVGSKVSLTVLRDGAKKTITASIRKMSAGGQGEAASPYLQGASLRTLHAGEVNYAQSGVLIGEVKAGSAADTAGLEPGDVIISANQQRVKNLKQLHAAVGHDKSRLLLRINRHGSVFFLVIR